MLGRGELTSDRESPATAREVGEKRTEEKEGEKHRKIGDGKVKMEMVIGEEKEKEDGETNRGKGNEKAPKGWRAPNRGKGREKYNLEKESKENGDRKSGALRKEEA
ncbi:hypothetical protein TIFTF001_019865 [Ficus carica]|uniref:Uncharacterized protein n=1 Tax=Ficus carica TaxID=3494 RepID=A0AA88A9L8_FICCA|nr:hypothetical protein TIFTF001_019865 [Ficus carica]